MGKLIVEDEETLKNLSKLLTVEFGKGFDERNLNNIRAFYNAFPIWNTVPTELSWTHYRIISRLETTPLRSGYIPLCIKGNWDIRTLQKNIKTQYIGRILEEGRLDQT